MALFIKTFIRQPTLKIPVILILFVESVIATFVTVILIMNYYYDFFFSAKSVHRQWLFKFLIDTYTHTDTQTNIHTHTHTQTHRLIHIGDLKG